MNVFKTGDLCFFDSNIWLYTLLLNQDVNKAKIANDLIDQHKNHLVVSTQVINEVVNTLIPNNGLAEDEIRKLIRSYHQHYHVVQVSESLQIEASYLREVYSLSHWDSLIIAAALEAKAIILYTEDRQNGLIVNNQLTLVNPFVP